MFRKRVERYLLEGIAVAVLIGVALTLTLPKFLDAQGVRGLGINAETGLQEIRVNIPGLPEEAKPLDMVRIPAGTFLMGSPPDERGRDNTKGSELSQCRVTIERVFYLGKYEVTQAQWQAVMGGNPPYFKGSDLPVEHVSWNDIQEFIKKLNARSGKGFRLPTEAEWEYACREGGRKVRYCNGKDEASKLAIHYNGGKFSINWGTE